jgi:hypothetical protein
MRKSGRNWTNIAGRSRKYSGILRSMDLKKIETAKFRGNKIEIPIQLGFSALFS